MISELLVYEPKSHNTNVSEALSFLCRVHKRQAVCFVISDFIDELSVVPFSLAARNHDLTAIAIVDPREKEWPDIGIIAICDFETGEEILIDSSSYDVREAIRKDHKERHKDLRKITRKVNAGYLCLETDKPFVNALKRYFSLHNKHKTM